MKQQHKHDIYKWSNNNNIYQLMKHKHTNIRTNVLYMQMYRIISDQFL